MKKLRNQVLDTMDEAGIIGQVDWPEDWNGGIDGGDSINRMAHYHFLIEANNSIGNNVADLANLPFRTKEDYSELLKLFECPESSGNYRRHPTNDWSAYCNGTYDGNMSRDQSLPLVISLAFMGFNKRLLMYFFRHLMRLLLFTTNTRKNGEDPTKTRWKLPDLTGPEFLSVYLRANPVLGYLLYPVLCVLDLELLLGSVLWRYRKSDDIINHATSLIFANIRVQTPISWLAAKILSKDMVLSKLKTYWCSWRKSCYYVNLYEPLINKIMK